MMRYTPLLAIVLIGATIAGCSSLPDLQTTEPAEDPQPTGQGTTPGESRPDSGASSCTITAVSSREITWTGPDLPWRAGGSPVSSACAEAHLYRADGSGGKFDWIRPDTKWRPFHNIHSGYGVWDRIGAPQRGERVTLIAVSRWNANDRITIAEWDWK